MLLTRMAAWRRFALLGGFAFVCAGLPRGGEAGGGEAPELPAAAVSGEREVVFARHARGNIVLDGRLDEDDWREARWVELDGVAPILPAAGPEREAWLNAFSYREGVEDQMAMSVRAAALWSVEGLYFGLSAQDADVTGRMGDGEALWLEDVLEVFIAPRAEAGVDKLEIQVNPANRRLFICPRPFSVEKARSAVHVDGTLNDSLSLDEGWSVELFIPWDALEEAGLARRPETPEGGEVAAVRFAAWDLSILSYLRKNSYTTPGDDNPHFPETYRRLICEAAE